MSRLRRLRFFFIFLQRRRRDTRANCAADGKIYKEALANVETIIQECLETAKELGRPIPAPRGPPGIRLTRLTCAPRIRRQRKRPVCPAVPIFRLQKAP